MANIDDIQALEFVLKTFEQAKLNSDQADDHLPLIMIILDENFHIIKENDRRRELSNNLGERLIGCHISKVFSPSSRKHLLRYQDTSSDEHKPHWFAESRDNGDKWYYWQIVPDKMMDKRIYRLIGNDITELRSYYEKNQELSRMVESLSIKQKMAQLGGMLVSVCHELKNLHSFGRSGSDYEYADVLIGGYDSISELWQDLQKAKLQYDPSQRRDIKKALGARHETSETTRDIYFNLSLLDISLEKCESYKVAVESLEDNKKIHFRAALGFLLLIKNNQSFMERSENIIHSVLNYARDNQDASCNPISVINDCVHFVSVKALEGKIDIDTNFVSNDLALFRESDLHQILLNLLLNASEALVGAAEEPWIKVEFDVEDDGNLYIDVTNNGCDLGEEAAAKIFDKGFSTKGRDGSGLGLYMSRFLAEKNGGTLNVSLKEDTITFRISLPRVQPGS